MKTGHDDKELLPMVGFKNKWGYVNPSGRWVIKPIYEAAANFSCGLGLVKTSLGVHFIDQDGKAAFPQTFAGPKTLLSMKSLLPSFIQQQNQVPQVHQQHTFPL